MYHIYLYAYRTLRRESEPVQTAHHSQEREELPPRPRISEADFALLPVGTTGLGSDPFGEEMPTDCSNGELHLKGTYKAGERRSHDSGFARYSLRMYRTSLCPPDPWKNLDVCAMPP